MVFFDVVFKLAHSLNPVLRVVIFCSMAWMDS